MSEFSRDGLVAPIPLAEAATVISARGINGLREALDSQAFTSQEERIAHVRALYENAWEIINGLVELTDETTAQPTQRILGTFTSIWGMLEAPETSNLATFAFYLRHRHDDDPNGDYDSNLLGAGFTSVQQQRFSDRLRELCFDAKLAGETSEDHHHLSDHLISYVGVAMTFKNMNPDIPDYFPTERLELDLMGLVKSEV